MARALNPFLQKKRKGTNHSEFLLCFLQISKKGMHDLEFVFCFLQKKQKEMHHTEFVFVLFCPMVCRFYIALLGNMSISNFVSACNLTLFFENSNLDHLQY